ncbi:MAG: GNAT family N-acetyltransferase [Candidatus Levybacteria bacterium]|nr:GNAT family N-acetyltransferase [Candidatus Levybacteria bacterium]
MAIIKKDEVSLRSFSDKDFVKLFQLIDKNRNHIGQWLSWVSKTHSEKDVKKTLLEWKEKDKRQETLHLKIFYNQSFVGVISFNTISKENKKAEIGYWLDKNYQGKGIMTKACKLLIEHGFNKLKLHRIEISCADGNSKSCAIPQRLGFKKEGYFKQAGLINGKFFDVNWFGLVVNDWKKI